MQYQKSIKVFAPATVANVGCGFDVFGFAVNKLGDVVEMRLKDSPGVALSEITGDNGVLPRDPNKNTVSAVVMDYLAKSGNSHIGVSIKLHKKMPIGSGMGSSAASSVAGLFAINRLLDTPIPKKDLLPLAMAGEKLACGQPHADNVAPSLLGGFMLIRSYDPLDVISLPTPDDLTCVLLHPKIEIRTEDARKIIRQQVKLKDAVTQWGNIAGFVSGLYQNDYNLIGRSMEDNLIEPSRAILIPEFYALKEKAMQTEALGFGISGSGPSVFAWAKGKERALKIQSALHNHLAKMEIESDSYISTVNNEGPTIIT